METYDASAIPIDEKLETVHEPGLLALFEQYAKLSHHLAFEGLISTIKLDDVDRFAIPWPRT